MISFVQPVRPSRHLSPSLAIPGLARASDLVPHTQMCLGAAVEIETPPLLALRTMHGLMQGLKKA